MISNPIASANACLAEDAARRAGVALSPSMKEEKKKATLSLSFSFHTDAPPIRPIAPSSRSPSNSIRSI